MKRAILRSILVLFIIAAPATAQYQQVYTFSQIDTAFLNPTSYPFESHDERDGWVLSLNASELEVPSTPILILRVENPPVTRNRFALTGVCENSLPDKTPPPKARLEVLTDFADGTSHVSTLDLNTSPPKTEFNIAVDVPPNTWPTKVQLNLVSNLPVVIDVRHPAIVEPLVNHPTTAPAVSENLLPSETIVRRFTRTDFDPPYEAQRIPGDWGSPGENAGGYYSTLFDGTTHAAFIIAKGRPKGNYAQFPQQNGSSPNPYLSRFRLIAVDSPAIVTGDFTVAGRISGTINPNDLPVDFANVRVQVSASTRDGHRLTGTCGLSNYTAGAASPQVFRIPFTNTGSSPITHLDMSVIVPGGALLAFDEVDLLAPRTRNAAASIVPIAVNIPSNQRPTVVSTPVQLDAEITDQLAAQISKIGPVQNWAGDDSLSRTLEFARTLLDDAPRRIELLSQDSPSLRPGTFGFTGTVFYEGLQPSTDMDGSAWFELTTDYADGTRTVTGTTAAFGPAGVMTGHSSDRPFAALVDSQVQPVRVRLDLLCRGTGRVRFSPVSLVQYEPIPTPVVAQAATPPWWTLPKVTRPAGFALTGAMVLAAIIFIIPAARPSTSGWLFFLFILAQGSFAWAMFLLGREVPLFNVMPLLTAALAWLLPLVAKWISGHRVRKQELRKIYSLDVAT